VARKLAFNAADLGAESEMDAQGRILFSPELRRELGIENQPVRLFAYRGRIEVLTEAIYEERKREASEMSPDELSTLEAAGLN
jgi:DNA-binding transcriptional regulator/RsmH inhibitor MraZ